MVRILIIGTLSGCSSVVNNALNAYLEIMILGEHVHFLRFLFSKCELYMKKMFIKCCTF